MHADSSRRRRYAKQRFLHETLAIYVVPRLHYFNWFPIGVVLITQRDDGVALVNISAEDIVERNEKLAAALA